MWPPIMTDGALLLALQYPRSVALPWMLRARLMDFDERDLVALAADTVFRNIHPLAVVVL
jgi:hypothetical protein